MSQPVLVLWIHKADRKDAQCQDVDKPTHFKFTDVYFLLSIRLPFFLASDTSTQLHSKQNTRGERLAAGNVKLLCHIQSKLEPNLFLCGGVCMCLCLCVCVASCVYVLHKLSISYTSLWLQWMTKSRPTAIKTQLVIHCSINMGH